MPFLNAFIFCAEIHQFSLYTAIYDELQPDLSPFSILKTASIKKKSLEKERSQNIHSFSIVSSFSQPLNLIEHIHFMLSA
jgi:hypothetical protein